ncbi:zinc finger CCHC domain-containing protein 7 isoform 2-T4 [Pholidichthys leucotaenia]
MCACVPEVMYSTYQDREQLEDDLYQEDEEDSEGSEANSELEFHLYSQLHYSSNTGELEELEKQEDGEEKAQTGEDRQQDSMTEATDVELKHIRKNKPPKKQEGVKEEEKKKKDSKAQKSQSLFFEEVIVIDSSPDVITVSDDDSASSDDDVGICAMKGQYARPMQTSTPAQQESQKRKIILEDLVTLSSSSSETESESECESKSECESESDASDSSDSDCLESWMIIGQGGQDGDQSISLNLEGGYDDNADAEDDQDRSWVVCDKDKEAQIYNKSPGARIVKQQMSNRYYTDKNVHCRNCDKMGHLSKSCTVSKKTSPCYLCGFPGHLASQCPNKYCNNCGLPGHHYGYCSEKPYYYKQCFRCNMKGHYLDACPEIWRQYHMTTSPGLPVRREKKNKSQHSVYCYNCSKKGHFGHDCTQRRMFSGVFPTNPFINHYDFKQEIKHREARLKKKVNDGSVVGKLPLQTVSLAFMHSLSTDVSTASQTISGCRA